MTKEDWGKIEKALTGTYGIARLQVDGHKVTFQRELVSKNRLSIVTYVDGLWKGSWISAKNECPESRYLRPMERFVWGTKSRAQINKLPKRTRSLLSIDANKKHRYFDITWPNVTTIRRHYQKTFVSIELIEVVG